ncbi:hypothetical protein V7S43_001658 [Phytophthora oleae]|uniref:Uncharacterized protein n=1 Tax=Phytophthora oleae TaxID=2107226 RepID=A0ABD3G4U9_9STRA
MPRRVLMLSAYRWTLFTIGNKGVVMLSGTSCIGFDLPFETKDGKYATHVCLLCAQERSCNPYAAPDAWEYGLHRFAHSTNALDHMYANHRDHSISQAYASTKMKNAVRHVDEAMTETHSQERKRSAATAIGTRPPKQITLQKVWMPSQKELGVYISYWLINAGLPFNTVATEDFKRLIQRATGDVNAGILSASTYRDLLGAVFSKFCKSTSKLLLREFGLAHRAPFLNLLHDTWTTANGKKGALGTSVRWIDETWTFREVALLVSVAFGSHASADMQRMFCSRVKKLYGLDIDTMTQFAVSNTTPSARKVSKLFEDALPTDYYMHVINLCLQYALGIRENKETVSVYDPITNTNKREKRYCTIGGAFEEGRLLGRRVRDLNNYFSTEQRCQRLEEVQGFYSLPKLAITLDCETRVAYTVRLFQRSMVNYSAFQGNFQKCDTGDDPTVFKRLGHADWLLMAELEAIVGAFADFARAEVQRKDLVASELIVLLKYTVDRLRCDEFMVCDIDAPRSATTTISSFPRYKVPVEELSPLGRTCLARLKGQVDRRIATATPETMLILLLDPRTKFSVESLIQLREVNTDGNGGNAYGQEAAQIQSIIDAGQQLLLDAHREVFRAMNASSNGVEEALTPTALPNLDLVPSAEDSKAICGAPINLNPRPTAPLTLNDRADKVLQDWMEYRVDWLDVAQQQATVETTADDYTPLLLVSKMAFRAGKLRAL